MMSNEKLNNLKNELIKTISNLDRGEIIMPDEHESHLKLLYFEFVGEVRDNIIEIEREKRESKPYIESLLNILEHLEKKLRSDFSFIINNVSGKHTRDHSDINGEEQIRVIALKESQIIVIENSLEFIRKLTQDGKMKVQLDLLKDKTWQDDLKDFYPEIMRIKEELRHIRCILERITFLQKERKRLAKSYLKDGVDLYSSPLNYFFESRIECLEEVLLLSNDDS